MIRCARWKRCVSGDEGSLWETRCRAGGDFHEVRVICYPGGGRCFGYVRGPRGIDGPVHGPTWRRVAIKLMSLLRRKGA